MLLLGLLFTIVSVNFGSSTVTEDKQYWNNIAEQEIKEALTHKWNTGKAKNVIIFVGDGMSPNTITATRIYNKGETSSLAWEKFPHVALLKTYNTNKQTPDSASTATALFSGVKTNFNVIGLDANVPAGDCTASLFTNHTVDSIVSWAQAAGRATGFVTTTRVTHATPAPLYAHSASRKWECEAKMPEKAKKCKDIARQLIEDEPGKNIRVIMGGGRQCLKSNATELPHDPIDTWSCYSTDGRDLIEDWKRDKAARNSSYKVVTNNLELSLVNPEKVDFLLGIFANGHLSMDYNRDTGSTGQPSLENMTTTAIKVLQKSKQGFLLVVEGGLIDFAHHRGHAAQALRETVRLSEAIEATMKLIDTSNTLVIVTSDHSHSMAFNGYSDRGSSILGIAQKSKIDGVPYTILSYGTGGPNNNAYIVSDNKTSRIDPSKFNTSDFTYSQHAAIITDEAYHEGSDVAVFAIGPYAHLFHSVHEQNFVAEVIAYAAKIGKYYNNSAQNSLYFSNFIFACIALVMTHYVIFR